MGNNNTKEEAPKLYLNRGGRSAEVDPQRVLKPHTLQPRLSGPTTNSPLVMNDGHRPAISDEALAKKREEQVSSGEKH